MKEFKKFIETYAKQSDLCKQYTEYTEDIITSLENVYMTCQRFNLLNCQTIYMLNQMLVPISKTRKREIKTVIKPVYVTKEVVKNEVKYEETSDTLNKMTIVNIAKYLGVSRQSIYKLLKNKDIYYGK